MSEVGLVAHQHDDDVGIGMITELAKPAFDILVRQMLGNVVDQESSDSTTVVPEMTSRLNIGYCLPEIKTNRCKHIFFEVDLPTNICNILTLM